MERMTVDVHAVVSGNNSRGPSFTSSKEDGEPKNLFFPLSEHHDLSDEALVPVLLSRCTEALVDDLKSDGHLQGDLGSFISKEEPSLDPKSQEQTETRDDTPRDENSTLFPGVAKSSSHQVMELEDCESREVPGSSSSKNSMDGDKSDGDKSIVPTTPIENSGQHNQPIIFIVDESVKTPGGVVAVDEESIVKKAEEESYHSSRIEDKPTSSETNVETFKTIEPHFLQPQVSLAKSRKGFLVDLFHAPSLLDSGNQETVLIIKDSQQWSLEDAGTFSKPSASVDEIDQTTALAKSSYGEPQMQVHPSQGDNPAFREQSFTMRGHDPKLPRVTTSSWNFLGARFWKRRSSMSPRRLEPEEKQELATKDNKVEDPLLRQDRDLCDAEKRDSDKKAILSEEEAFSGRISSNKEISMSTKPASGQESGGTSVEDDSSIYSPMTDLPMYKRIGQCVTRESVQPQERDEIVASAFPSARTNGSFLTYASASTLKILQDLAGTKATGQACFSNDMIFEANSTVDNSNTVGQGQCELSERTPLERVESASRSAISTGLQGRTKSQDDMGVNIETSLSSSLQRLEVVETGIGKQTESAAPHISIDSKVHYEVSAATEGKQAKTRSLFANGRIRRYEQRIDPVRVYEPTPKLQTIYEEPEWIAESSNQTKSAPFSKKTFSQKESPPKEETGVPENKASIPENLSKKDVAPEQNHAATAENFPKVRFKKALPGHEVAVIQDVACFAYTVHDVAGTATKSILSSKKSRLVKKLFFPGRSKGSKKEELSAEETCKSTTKSSGNLQPTHSRPLRPSRNREQSRPKAEAIANELVGTVEFDPRDSSLALAPVELAGCFGMANPSIQTPAEPNDRQYPETQKTPKRNNAANKEEIRKTTMTTDEEQQCDMLRSIYDIMEETDGSETEKRDHFSYSNYYHRKLEDAQKEHPKFNSFDWQNDPLSSFSFEMYSESSESQDEPSTNSL